MKIRVYGVDTKTDAPVKLDLTIPYGKDPMIAAEEVIVSHNSERGPPYRQLCWLKIVSVRVLLSPTLIPHDFRKTNTTIMDKNGLYEIHVCKRCGMKGHKYDGDQDVRPAQLTKWYNACGIIEPLLWKETQ